MCLSVASLTFSCSSFTCGNFAILQQVDNLQYATLATVSRCGMVWFSAAEAEAEAGIDSDIPANPGTVTNDMLLRHKVGAGACEPHLSLLSLIFGPLGMPGRSIVVVFILHMYLPP